MTTTRVVGRRSRRGEGAVKRDRSSYVTCTLIREGELEHSTIRSTPGCVTWKEEEEARVCTVVTDVDGVGW